MLVAEFWGGGYAAPGKHAAVQHTSASGVRTTNQSAGVCGVPSIYTQRRGRGFAAYVAAKSGVVKNENLQVGF
jgi:hypothetical protein